jgi:hypothetical protein
MTIPTVSTPISKSAATGTVRFGLSVAACRRVSALSTTSGAVQAGADARVFSGFLELLLGQPHLVADQRDVCDDS